MSRLVLFNKPFQILSQFTDDKDRKTLKEFISMPNFYPAGRLDYDSEGLLLLTDNGQLQNRISAPKFKLPKTYLVQVEGKITEEAIFALQQGVTLKDGPAKASKAKIIQDPALWQRTPPIRHRENAPTSWLSLEISEGRNRQVRRMTANIGFPTLRLVRSTIGPWSIENLAPGEFKTIDVYMPTEKTEKKHYSKKNIRPKFKGKPKKR